MNKQKLIVIVVLSLMLLILPLTTSLSFLLNPIINSGGTTYTTDDLNCVWSYSGDTINQTINWYKDGVLNKTIFENSSLSTNNTLPSTYTAKNQEWICEVILRNATWNESKNDSLTIKDAPPIKPKLYNGSTELTGIINVIEDQTYNFIVNSTDPDEDTLTYYAEPSKASTYFCTITDSDIGAMTCRPTQSDLINNNYTLINESFFASDSPSNPGDSLTKESAFTFNITPVNDAPIALLSDQTIDINQELDVNFTVSDEENNTINAILDTTNTDSEIVGKVNVNMNGTSQIRVTYFDPSNYNAVGNRTISINVSDDQGAWHLQNFTLTINSINRAPRFVNISPSGPYTIPEGQNLIINITSNDTDVDDGFKTEETIILSTNFTRTIHQNIQTTANLTTNAFSIINFTPRSDEVGIHNIQLIISDGEDQNTTNIIINVTNINQAPIIYNMSYYEENTLNNINISNLTAYVDSPFIYRLNWTDADLYLGDIISFTTNTTLFNIQSNGTISFTPNSTSIGNYSILITANDSEVQTNVTLNLEIRNNSKPSFNQTFANPVYCDEENICFFNLSDYADDANDNISYFNYSLINSTNNQSLNISFNSTGFFNFTPAQENVGNYTFRFVVYDTYGANDTQEMNLTIRNVNDIPVWERYNFSSKTIVESKYFSYELRVSDQDLLLANSQEGINITSNLSFVNIGQVQIINGTDTVIALLSFTPNASLIGNHTINLTATDKNNTNSSVSFTFTILEKTDPPIIENFQPYGNSSNSYYYVADFKSTAGYTSNLEAIRFLENTSNVTFEVGASDVVTPKNQLTYEWYYDNVSLGVSENKTNISFDFYDSGSHNITVVVNDTTLESTSWTWLVTVENVNQVPILVNDLEDNLTIDYTEIKNGYFRLYAGNGDYASKVRFYDPDDDLDEDGSIDNGETQRLNYTHTPCGVATIIFYDNDSLKLIPTSVGICTVRFTATDDENASVSSNPVNITVLSVPSGDQVAPDNPIGGGGGGSSSSPIVIPISNDVEVPKPLTIISPEVASTYENRTIKIPIIIHNNWTSNIKGIKLGVELPKDKPDILYKFETDYIEELDINQSINTTLLVTGYRLGDDFELKILANSSNPKFGDESLVLFNSIEKGSDEKEMEAKVTFAQDLLNENSECQELAELLDKGNEYLKKGNLSEAAKYIDVAINGCKYLISKTKPVDEKPSLFNKNSWELNEETLKYFSYVALIIGIIVGIILITVYHFKDKEEYDF